MPSTEVFLLFAATAVTLLLFDWSEGGSRDTDFALGADMLFLFLGLGLYPAVIVMLRRFASAITREGRARRRAPLALAYVCLPPAVVAALMWAHPVRVAPPDWGWLVVLGAVYVCTDAILGVALRADFIYWPWALEANLRTYGWLWGSQISLALLGIVILQWMGLVAIVLFTLLALFLRVAFGLVRNVLDLYSSTTKAMSVALSAALSRDRDSDERLAAAAFDSATRLGFPDADAARLKSAAWLLSLMQAAESDVGSIRGILDSDHAALVDVLAILEPDHAPKSSSGRTRLALGSVLSAVSGAMEGSQDGSAGLSALPARAAERVRQVVAAELSPRG